MIQNGKKLKELILYIFNNYNNSNLTETKLQKLLYYCDFNYYQKYGQPITGFSYSKNTHGPTIKVLPKILQELEKEGYIKRLKKQNYYGAPQTNFVALKMIEPSFNDSEKLIIDNVNGSYSGLNSREISTLSHKDPPYIVTEDQKEIDYDSVVYRSYGEVDEKCNDEEAQKYFDKAKLDKLFLEK